MMKTLFISSYYLFADTRFGGSKRLYYFAKALEKCGEVYVICHDGCGELAGSTDAMPRTDFSHFLFLPIGETRNLFGKFLRPGYDTRRFLNANAGVIREFLGAADVDAAFLAYPLALSFIGTVVPAGTRPIVYLEDDLLIESIAAHKGNNVLDLYRAVRLKQMRWYYAEKLSHVDAFVSISSQEEALVKRYFPGVNSHIIKYGIPLDDYCFFASRPKDFTVGFIGNFLHVPNADALGWFLQKVYPVLVHAAPGIRVLIAGKNIPERLRGEFAGDTSLAWVENTPQLGDFYRSISVFVNPIVSGRGLRTKLVEAAAFGRPIVSTSLGAEGYEDLTIDIADGHTHFAERCLALKNDVSHYEHCAESNRKTVEQMYSLEAVGRQLLSLLQRNN